MPSFVSALRLPIVLLSLCSLPGSGIAADINLAWNADPSPSIAGYRLHSGTSSGVYTQITELGNATSTLVSNLTDGKTYFFTVTAYNNGGFESPPSNEVSYNSSSTPTPTPTPTSTPTPTPTATATPAAPSNLKATTASSSRINLSWTDNSTNESGFKIERSTNGTTFAKIGTVGAQTTTYASTGLSASTKYYYRIRAYNSTGDSAYSNTTSATTTTTSSTPTPTPTPTPTATPKPTATPTPTPTPSPTSTPTGVPAPPSNLKAMTFFSNSIYLFWTDNSTNENGFAIERSTDGTTFAQIATVAANVTVYASTGLAGSTTYYYRVRAYNAGGNSGYSNTASAATRTSSGSTPTPTPTPTPNPTPTPTPSPSPTTTPTPTQSPSPTPTPTATPTPRDPRDRSGNR